MRKLILSMQVTLDGYIEGAHRDMSWMQPDDEEGWQELFGMLEEVDLFLLGRCMWSDYRDYWQKVLEQEKPDKNELAYAQLADRTRHIVFSNTLQESGWKNTCILDGVLKDEVIKLKHTPGKSIQAVGGGKLTAGLINAGVVDEYRVVVNPVMIGGGEAFFQDVKTRYNLQLVDTKRLRTGVVTLIYTSQQPKV